MKKRYYFMDVLRLLCMAGIVYYHMVFALYQKGIRQLDSVVYLFQNSNMHIAKVSVGIFFMMSGAGLMLSTKDKSPFDIKDYFKKRFLKILVPFYLVYVLYLLAFMALSGESLSGVYNRTLHPLSFIFTLLGMDAYLSSFGVSTFSLGIGEWFLGALMLMYILFPIIRWALLKNKYVTFMIATVYYVVTIATYHLLPYAATNPGYVNFTVKIYDFFLGMFLILIIDKIPKWISFGVGIPVILFYLLYPNPLGINDNLMILSQILAVFLFFRGLEDVFKKIPKVMKLITFLCGYTYEFFLIHHVVVDYMTLQVAGRPFSNMNVLVLFICEILVISILTVLVKFLLSLPSRVKKIYLQKKQNSGD